MAFTPIIQISFNDSILDLFWDMDKTMYYSHFKLYASTSSDMSSSIAILNNIPNAPSTEYDKNKTFIRIPRHTITSALSLSDNNSPFYLKLKGIHNGIEDISFDTSIPATLVPDPRTKPPYYDVSMIYTYTGAVWVP